MDITKRRANKVQSADRGAALTEVAIVVVLVSVVAMIPLMKLGDGSKKTFCNVYDTGFYNVTDAEQNIGVYANCGVLYGEEEFDPPIEPFTLETVP
jgi:Flp pilus assembly pilin Flp